MWQETEGSVWPAAREEMKSSVQKSVRTWGLPTTSGVSLEVAPPLAEPRDEAVAMAESLTTTPSETLSQDHLAKPLLAFWLSKTASNNTALLF